MRAFLVAASVALAAAQDPADGWMAYAVGTVPAGTQRITRLEMQWKVGANPNPSSAFYSPWFGMDPADNLNLIQPVNPWLGSAPWAMYTEYYQWSNGYNSNSPQKDVNAGQTLHGVLQYIAEQDSYNLTQTVVETGVTSQQIVQCQNGKKFVIPYVVYEKTWQCSVYPPDEVVTFTNIKVICDNKDCTATTKWAAKVKDPNCAMTAHVDKYPQQISITWSTSMESKYDSWSQEDLFARNANGWAANFTRN